jgi:hypothetical protein
MNKTNQSKALSRSAFLRTMALGLPLISAATLRAASPAPAVNPDSGNLRTFVELARSDIRNEKSVILAENMDFTTDEAVEFWPIQHDYEMDLNKLLDRRYNLIMQYARDYPNMSAEQAKRLSEQVFDLEEKRTDLKRKYFKKFCKVIPPQKAARFFQIENQLNMTIDLQVAAALPLIK